MEPIHAATLINSEIVNEQICPICRENFELNSHKLTCGHTYHANCIIEWFRNSPTCPMCRSEPETFISRDVKQARSNFIKNFSRRKDAPKHLKKLVEKLKNIKRKERQIQKSFSEWKKTPDGIRFKELTKIENKLRRPRYTLWRNIRKLETEISEYPIVYIPILKNTKDLE